MITPNLDLVQYKLPYESFIGGWYIPEHICDGMLQYYYEKEKNIYQGVVGTKLGKDNVVIKEVKDSLDLNIEVDDKSADVQAYNNYLVSCLYNYNQYYTHSNEMRGYGLNRDYNIQRYRKGGGFKKWHFERSHIGGFNRVLVFMTYLNDVEDGGTEFYYQKIKTKAKKGLTLIWPTDFTHTHRGIVSKTKEKYIVTGWFTV
jgi:hypothetical protein|tara:strand:+ start:1572 stop:2174 length:603 start_codon:yes stop_codon:yes gene_type:complete